MTPSHPKICNPFLEMFVDLGAIVRNYKKIQNFTKTQVAAVVKADAYGIGAVPVAKALSENGCEKFYVATIDEALTLRAALPKTTKIYLFNAFTENQLDLLVQQKITPVLTSLEQIKLWQKKSDNLVLHFDTGINRLSIPLSDIEACLKQVNTGHVETVMSHLSCADLQEHALNKIQLKRFQELATHFPKSTKSFAASKGINLGSSFLFDEVRVGIYLYGFSPAATTKFSRELDTAIQARAQILEVKTLLKGESVGYGATFTAKRDMKIATVSAGYADGVPLSYSNKISLDLEGHKVPILGKVSMDLSVIDLSDAPEELAKVGKWVDLIPDPMSFYKMSRTAGSNPHEMLTRLGQRYRRTYKE